MTTPMWCDACRSTGAVHCAHPDECGNMKSATVAAENWKAWLDDLPLPFTFDPAIGRLQDFLDALTSLIDVPQPAQPALADAPEVQALIDAAVDKALENAAIAFNDCACGHDSPTDICMAHINILNRVRPDHPAFARAREDAVKVERERCAKAVEEYASQMLKIAVYTYHCDIVGGPITVDFSDFLTPDAEDAKALGVIDSDKWDYYSDIRNDEMRETNEAAIKIALAPLAAAIRSQP